MRNHKVGTGTVVGLALTMFLVVVWPVSTVQANGCSAVAATPPTTVTERTTAAPIVFEGSVTALIGNEVSAIARVEVIQYLKGSGPALVYIAGYHKEATLYECADWVDIGDHLIFYSSRDPESGRLHRFVVGARGSTTSASSLAEAITAVGQQPVTPYPETEAPPRTPVFMAGTPTLIAASATPGRTQGSLPLAIMFLMISGVTGTAAILLILRSAYVQGKKQP